MMLREMNRRTLLSLVALVILVILSAAILGYFGLNTFSPSMGTDVLRGLGQPDWQFLCDGNGEDLISLLLLIIGIACLRTIIATVLAIPITLISAVNLWQAHPWVTKIGKLICNVLRALPGLVFAIIFVKVVGPGPFVGIMMIGVHRIGMLDKLFTKEMEAMDERLVEEMHAVGASSWQTIFSVRIPYLTPIYCSLALDHFEIAARSAATLGLVGAGGTGAPLIFAIQTRSWSKMSIILIGVVVTVFILDQITGIIRKRLR